MVVLSPSSGVVLVTGANGLVGGHVCNLLRSKGYSVRAAVRDPSSDKVSFLSAMGCELARVPGLLSDEGWADAMAGCVGLMHVASPVSLGGDADADSMVNQAVSGTERALRFAAEAGTVKRVVVTATMASVCGSQRDTNPDHIWSEADKNDAPGSAYSKSKTAAEAKVWEMAETHKGMYDVTTVHPAVVLGPMVDGQQLSSTMAMFQSMLKGKVAPMMFGLCSAADVALVHLAGIEREESAGQRCVPLRPEPSLPDGLVHPPRPNSRPPPLPPPATSHTGRYLVCSTDQFSTFELVQMAKAEAPEAATAVDLDAWRADEKVQAMAPKKPATNNAKACKLLGVDALEPPLQFVGEAARSLKARGDV